MALEKELWVAVNQKVAKETIDKGQLTSQVENFKGSNQTLTDEMDNME